MSDVAIVDLSEAKPSDRGTVKLVWGTEQRQVKSLVPYEHNPRRMSAEQKKKLRESLEEFGLVEIPAINQDNVLIAGHQRVDAMLLLGMGDELIDVRVPNRLLTEKELKQYNVNSNAIKGNWLNDVLKEHFGDVDTSGFAFDFAELDKLAEKGQPKEAEEKPEYPIVAEFSEQYDAIVIVSTNEIDFNFLAEVLKLRTEQSYKKADVGTSMVITGKRFIELWKSRS
jgi:hypothetical protein